MSDAAEASLRAKAVSNTTKSSMVWGIRVWNEWASNRATAVAGNDEVAQMTMPLKYAQWSSVLDGKVCVRGAQEGRQLVPTKIFACCFKHFWQQLLHKETLGFSSITHEASNTPSVLVIQLLLHT